MMTKGDRAGRIFLSHPHTNIGFFFLLTTKHCILYWKKNMKRLPEDPEFAEIRHGDVILTLRASSVRPTCGLFVIIFPTDWYGYVR